MTLLPDAALPDGLRLYVVGDVHGCLDQLLAVEEAIRRDLAARPAGAFHTIMLGDYIDRGPDSRGVLAWLVDREDALRLLALRGNHEAMMADFLADPERGALALWTANGGAATLASFGLDPGSDFHAPDMRARLRLRDRLAGMLERDLDGVLDRLEPMLRFGDYVFVHAGLRPGVAIEAQEESDLLWIREPFLASWEDLGAVVVHGHTPTREVVVRPNRIGIDTGAVFGGSLSCLVLEGASRALLRVGERRPL